MVVLLLGEDNKVRKEMIIMMDKEGRDDMRMG